MNLCINTNPIRFVLQIEKTACFSLYFRNFKPFSLVGFEKTLVSPPWPHFDLGLTTASWAATTVGLFLFVFIDPSINSATLK